MVACPLRAGETVYVSRGAEWTYFKGTQQPSGPLGAWRTPAFDDAAWLRGPAPIGYGETVFDATGTRIGDMEDNYTTIFLRHTFQVGAPGNVAALRLDCNYDDGFVAWINGTEVLRLNVDGAPGDEVPLTAGTPVAREYVTAVVNDLADPAAYLVQGTNVLAVHLVNRNLASSDLYFDCALADPFGPDTTPPALASRVPAPGAVVRALSQVAVTFNEPVEGIDAGDLIIGAAPATSVSGQGAGPYVFACAAQPDGTVAIGFAPGHGITDLAEPPNVFAGGAWTCTLDSTLPLAQVVINEFLAANRAGLTDQDGDFEDWIELHNRGAEAAALTGWSLTDDPDEPGKWVFPDVSLASGAYLVVFASGKDRRPTAGELHTSFKLDSSGEYLGLYSADSPRQVIAEFAPQFPPQRSDYSYGLSGSSATGYFDPPTPRAANNALASFDGFCADPTSSVPRGLREGTPPISLELHCETPGAEIFYTLDVSEPGRTNGTRYVAALSLSGTARSPSRIVRAVAYAPGLLPSNHVTFTYVFVANVPSQAVDPLGFPTTWPNAPAADYGMDPEIVGNAAYTSLVEAGLQELPSLSVVCDFDDLFSASTGIYANPTQEGSAWERAASVELLYPDGREGFQHNCGLRVQGGAGREPAKSPKHSFRVIFRGDYGPTRLAHALFPDSRVSSFENVVLRAGFNNAWTHWDGAQRAKAQYVRDQWARDTLRDIGRPTSHGIYVNLYLNGVYWGLYNVCERPDAPFAAAYLGGDSEDYDALNAGVPVDGDKNAWNRMMTIVNAGLASETGYAALQEYLDVPGFVDYMLVNIYGANQDWPHQNWYAARRREAGAQYRLFAWDSERTLEDPAADGLARIVPANGDLGTVFTRLKDNPEYRLLFADRAHRHLMNGGALTPAPAAGRWSATPDPIEAAVAAESARWGDYRRDVHQYSNGPYLLYTLNDHWLPEQNRLLTQYFPQRTAVVLAQLKTAGLYPSVGAPVFNKHGGVIAAGFALTMSMPAGTTGVMYYTLDGGDPRVYGTGAVAPAATAYTAAVVLDDPTHVKARTLRNGVWSALTESVFSIPRPLDALRVTEIMYHPAGAGDEPADRYEFVELQNTGAVVLDASGVSLGGGVDYVFPEGVILDPGAIVVLAADTDGFAVRYPAVSLLGAYRRDLGNSGDTLTVRGPQGELLEAVTYLDTSPWPVEADGLGYSLVPSGQAQDPNDPLYWRPSTMLGGSPGAVDPPPQVDEPQILQDPRDVSVLEGEAARFEIVVAGTPPLRYQWQRNGEDVPDATESAYLIARTLRADDGARVRCVVRNSGGAATSAEATLRVGVPATEFLRGNANGDTSLDISDAVATLGYLFARGKVGCVKACDTNDDGRVNIADPVALLGYLFALAAPPAEPFWSCGNDATSDSLSCESFPGCSK